VAKETVQAKKLQVERLQTRVSTDSTYIEELADRMKSGAAFPPITVVRNGSGAWLADGIHRLDAAIMAGKKIEVNYIAGDRKKAVEIACGANQSHGLRRSNADKRRAVGMALKEFSGKSDRALADMCGVGRPLVAELRSSQVAEKPPGNSTRTGKDGKNYKVPVPKPPTKPSSAATDFDPGNLPPAAATKPPKPGKATVTVKQRKACHTHLGGLIRSLQSVGIYDEFLGALNQIAERLKQI